MPKRTIEETVWDALGMFDQDITASVNDIAVMTAAISQMCLSYRQVRNALYRMRTGMNYPMLNWHKAYGYSWGLPF